jgi:hypothetical protein
MRKIMQWVLAAILVCGASVNQGKRSLIQAWIKDLLIKKYIRKA